MKIAIITSNTQSITPSAKKGTEIFSNILINELSKNAVRHNLDITAFASGDSKLPVKIESITQKSTSQNTDIPDEKKIIFELALLSEAFSRQNEFDLYHVNIGDGDIALPFAKFVKKPIIITIHNTKTENYVKKYFSHFSNLPNVFFVSISDAQRKYFPKLNYLDTIYHGVDINNNFKFSSIGGNAIMWAGRAIPQKGMDAAIDIASSCKKQLKMFGISNDEYNKWLSEFVIEKIKLLDGITITFNKDRLELAKEYGTSKLFLFPLQWEEPFGLTVIESMACGTPVIAYGRGSMPEIIEDGKTGFIVNPSADDIRGNWVVKKTGIEGMIEAVEKLYAMSESEYMQMRRNCRQLVEKKFAVRLMSENYVKIYNKTINAMNSVLK